MARKPIRKKQTKDYHTPKMMKLADGTEVMERYHNDRGSKPIFQKEVKDPERKKKPLSDVASKHKYPPPKRNAVFRESWMKFIDGLVSRESFKVGHLAALEVLCDLYVEYEDLERIIRTEGRTYKTVTRLGEHRKMHPAVAQLDKVRANIRAYTKQLDLFPKRDTGNSEADGEEAEWT